MKYYSIGEFTNRIGKNIQTLRNWDKKKMIKELVEDDKDIKNNANSK